MSEVLRTIPVRLGREHLANYCPGTQPREAPVERTDGTSPTVTVLDSLMAEVGQRIRASRWEKREDSDRWLAPRVHWALRLHRAEAADKGVWQWLALRYRDYVEWRWTGTDGTITNDRWWGPIHKQSMARLWWGAEIFRNGPDYHPVEQAFTYQDVPNGYLHRPIVRCRSLAVVIADRVATAGGAASKRANDLARVLNLATAGIPPEVETGYQTDDDPAYAKWCAELPVVPSSWDPLPTGPTAIDTSVASLTGASRIVDRGWRYAGLDAAEQ